MSSATSTSDAGGTPTLPSWQLFALAGLAISAGLALAPAAQAQPASGVEGVWRNPKNSVHVNIKPCGQKLCGFVVWASPDAQEDARKGGTRGLVGTTLLSGLRSDGNGGWKGRAYLPKRNMHAGATVRAIGRDTLLVKGCALAGLICKEQRWTRVN